MATVADLEQQLHVSPSIDERAIDHHAPRQIGNVKAEPEPEHLALSGAMRIAREEAHALVALAEAVYGDGSQTPEAAVIQLATAAQKTGERVAARLVAAQAKVDVTIASIEKATFAPEGASPLDPEIRSALKDMTPDQRSEALSAALEAGDMTLIGSVLRAPGLLTRMKAAELASLRHRYQQKHFPAEMARLERLRKMRAAADVGGGAFVKLVKQVGEGRFGKFASAAKAARSKRESALAAHQQKEI